MAAAKRKAEPKKYQYGLRQDCSNALRIPYMDTHAPTAPQPDLELPLYTYQLRNIHRMKTIEQYTKGGHKDDFNTFLQYNPRGGVIADSTGMGKTATVIGLVLSEPVRNDIGPNLIVTPSHLFTQWKNETEKFAGARLRIIEGLANYEEALRISQLGDGAVLNNRCMVIIDVAEVLKKTSKKYYDFRKVYNCTKCKMSKDWVRVLDEDSGTILHYKHKKTGRTQTNIPESEEPDLSSLKLLKLSKVVADSYRSAATFVSGAYAGWVYDSVLHMPPHKKWRRVIFDEVHDLVESDSDGVGSVSQNNFIQLTRTCENVWLMSATPFPKGNKSVYGLHQLLGFHRLKLHIEVSHHLQANHTFEIIKRKLYVKNHASVKSSISDTIEVVHNTIMVDFVAAEAAFYHAQNQNIHDVHAANKSVRENPYHPVRDEQRRMCCHPAASMELRAAFSRGGGGSNAQQMSVADLTERMVAGRRVEVDTLKQELRLCKSTVHLAVNSVNVAEYIEEQEHMVNSLALSEQERNTAKSHAWVDDDVKIKTLMCEGLVTTMTPFNPHENHAAYSPNLPSRLDSFVEAQSYIKKHLIRNKDFFDYFVRRARGFVTTNSTKLKAQDKKIKELESNMVYFDRIFASIKDAGPEGPTCPICFSESLRLAFPECGHYVCHSCMTRWKGEKVATTTPCPTCRKPLDSSNVMYINTAPTPKHDDGLASSYGSKPAALVRYLKAMIASDKTNKAIVFSMWNDVLHIISSTLTELGVRNVFCEGSGERKEKAIADFNTDPTLHVLMLSATVSASGANLQIANHLVLLDPPGHNPAHGAALENQAIGRSVRLGQKRAVSITRFVTRDTIEETLTQQNKKAASKETATGGTAAPYLCEQTELDENMDEPDVKRLKSENDVMIVDVSAGGGEAENVAVTPYSTSSSLTSSSSSVSSSSSITTTTTTTTTPTASTASLPSPSSLSPSLSSSVTVPQLTPLFTPTPTRATSSTINSPVFSGLSKKKYKTFEEKPRIQIKKQADCFEQLIAMGFSASDSMLALKTCDYTVDRAINMILMGNLPITLD